MFVPIRGFCLLAMNKTVLRCAGSTAKVLVFVAHVLLLVLIVFLFKLSDESVWRPFFLVLILLVSFSSCAFGMCVGSVDCGRTKVEIRRSKTPLVFTIDIPIERTLRAPSMLTPENGLPSYDQAVKSAFIV